MALRRFKYAFLLIFALIFTGFGLADAWAVTCTSAQQAFCTQQGASATCESDKAGSFKRCQSHTPTIPNYSMQEEITCTSSSGKRVVGCQVDVAGVTQIGVCDATICDWCGTSKSTGQFTCENCTENPTDSSITCK